MLGKSFKGELFLYSQVTVMTYQLGIRIQCGATKLILLQYSLAIDYQCFYVLSKGQLFTCEPTTDNNC